MPSKTSLFNKEIFLQIVRSTGWISLIYFLGLLFSLPIRILMIYTENNTYKRTPEMVESLFQYDLHIQVILFVAIPILMSIFLFRFLQVKQSAEFMHSLPIKREKIYHQYTLSGIIGLVLPVILVTIILLIMHSILDLNSYFQIKSIIYLERYHNSIKFAYVYGRGFCSDDDRNLSRSRSVNLRILAISSWNYLAVIFQFKSIIIRLSR